MPDIETLTAERDRARRTAVALEQENARLLEVIADIQGRVIDIALDLAGELVKAGK